MPIKKYIPLVLKKRVRALQKQVGLINAKHYCPVCGATVSAFLPLPKFFRENQEKYGFPYQAKDAETCNEGAYLCPACGASDRDRLYALFLADYIRGLESGAQIVDFAPSEPLSAFIRRVIKSSGKDVRYRTADLLAENVDDRVDIADLRTYERGQFELFICSHVLEHVPDDRRALRELHRILKPGGKGILMVPIILGLEQIDEDPKISDEGERWRRFGQGDHVRLYSRRGFLERIHDAGFQVHELDQQFFSAQSFTTTGITPQSILYIVEK